ncbi:MAG: type IV secretion system DNA-binding domain-containing protein [Candidatus Moranbacteria bacterium]|nr:type IV secretion system DNA-binding domain-containing protein [Candidatus Moranbacteria bacterium]MDD3965153.1 type IV secretion system DNA-binding domain-containing protein [Candidatus Moranbacteria bacterium]
MTGLDLNILLIPLVYLLASVAIISGTFLVIRSFFRFRYQINQSMNMDLEMIRVTRKEIPEGAQQAPNAEAWKEEIFAMEQLLASLTVLKPKGGFFKGLFFDTPTIIFEIANPSSSEEIFFYLSVPKRFRESAEKQIHSFFPHAVIEKATEYTIFSPGGYTAVSVLDLVHSHALPLRTYRGLDVDPLNVISNALSKLNSIEEGISLQILLTRTNTAWRSEGKKIAQRMQEGKRLKDAKHQSMLREASASFGKEMMKTLTSSKEKNSILDDKKQVNLTPEEQELVKSIDEKTNKGAFRANIRLIASAGTQERAEEILGHLENAFGQFENPEVNTFRIKKRISEKQAVYDFIFRNFNDEQQMILSVEELASIFHFPISTTATPKIKWLKAGAAPPPVNIPEEGLLLGYNDYRGTKTDIRITENDRRRHMYVIGQTGVGKSVYLQEMAKKDALAGHGFCFIDPHGDAIEDILTAIPKERAEDVILFDPSDTERPIGLNMLEYDAQHPEQKTFVINEMIGIFDQLYDLKATGGPMFEQYMRNAMLLIMEDPESGSTLMEISKVLADEDFRKYKLSKCNNPIAYDFWTKEAEKAGGEAALANMVPYITSKLTTFISNDMMRPIIGQQKSTLNFREIMDGKKILLVNLSKGKIGEINAKLLGMVIVGKILMAALSRVDTPEEERTDFYLYMDEFQNVTTNSIAQILSEARKYRLVLTMAHQFIAQLKEEISKAVFGNVGSLVSFRIGSEDAEFLEKQFLPVFSARDLMNVDNRNCFARLLMNNELTKPFNMKTYAPTNGSQEIANALKELSRLRYGRDATIVNREIMNRMRLAEKPL